MASSLDQYVKAFLAGDSSYPVLLGLRQFIKSDRTTTMWKLFDELKKIPAKSDWIRLATFFVEKADMTREEIKMQELDYDAYQAILRSECQHKTEQHATRLFTGLVSKILSSKHAILPRILFVFFWFLLFLLI